MARPTLDAEREASLPMDHEVDDGRARTCDDDVLTGQHFLDQPGQLRFDCYSNWIWSASIRISTIQKGI